MIDLNSFQGFMSLKRIAILATVVGTPYNNAGASRLHDATFMKYKHCH